MADIVKIQLRRGVASLWTTNDPVLGSGEPGYETDTGKLKFGDGATVWTALPYFNEGDKNFIFTQAIADTTWTITHNLDKFPSVTVFDSAGTSYIGQVINTDTNNLTIDFNHALSGKAYLN